MAETELWLARHGETEWSKSGQHTGRTDLPLTENGKAAARALRSLLGDQHFDLALTSPLQRARETCSLAGFGDAAESDPDLCEWHYGDYEGLTTDEIRRTRPGWTVFADGCPNGETAADVGARADRVIERVVSVGPGRVIAFAHGHVLRVLAARWVGLAPTDGSRFVLGTATISILGWDREAPVITRWNAG